MTEQFLRRFSLTRAVMWLGVIPVAYYFGWLASVVFVSGCSIYANAASDFASYRADSNKKIEAKLEEILELLRK